MAKVTTTEGKGLEESNKKEDNTSLEGPLKGLQKGHSVRGGLESAWGATR